MPLTRLKVPLVMNRPGFHGAVLLAASSFHGLCWRLRLFMGFVGGFVFSWAV
jgi:hypothetical protein